ASLNAYARRVLARPLVDQPLVGKGRELLGARVLNKPQCSVEIVPGHEISPRRLGVIIGLLEKPRLGLPLEAAGPCRPVALRPVLYERTEDGGLHGRLRVSSLLASARLQSRLSRGGCETGTVVPAATRSRGFRRSLRTAGLLDLHSRL